MWGPTLTANARRNALLRIAVLLGLLGITIFLYGYFYERNSIVLEKITINVASAPSELKDIKMIQLSDLHFKNPGPREKKVQIMVNKVKPDIIFFTGDLFDSINELENPKVFDDAIEFLASLSFKKHFFFVFGEDEYYYRDYLKKRLREANVMVLDNEIYCVDFGNTKLNIIGITKDPKDLDAFYNDDRHHKYNIKRFIEFSKMPQLEDCRNYRYYIKGPYALKWEDYEITAEIRISPVHDRVGVAFYSQFPMGIYKSYFMELDSRRRVFCVISTEENDLKGRKCSGVRVREGTPYKVKIHSKSIPGMTRIRAKVWESKDEEPPQWQINCYDMGKNRSSEGAIGLFSINGISNSPFCNIKVRMLEYDHNCNMAREGVREVPLNMKQEEIIIQKYLWLTLDDLEDLIYNKQKTGEPFLLEKKLKEIVGKYDLTGFTILLSHSPEIIKVVKNKDIDLVLSGDTHGGQIDLPLIDKYIYDSYDGKLLKRGLKYFFGTYLYINRGIGTSIVPIRLNCRPEITLLTLN